MTTLLVLVFVIQPGGQMQIMQRLPMIDRQSCMEVVRKINDDKAHPFNAACYETTATRSS